MPTPPNSFTGWHYSGIILPLMFTLTLSLADMRMVRWAMPTLILRTPRYRRKSCVWSELRFTQTEGAPALVPPLSPSRIPSALIKRLRSSRQGCLEESRGHFQEAGKGLKRWPSWWWLTQEPLHIWMAQTDFLSLIFPIDFTLFVNKTIKWKVLWTGDDHCGLTGLGPALAPSL